MIGPESPTTGRWRITKHVAEQAVGGRRDWMHRDSGVPLWYRILDRFGFPTFFGVLTLATLIWLIRADREDRQADRQAFVKAIDAHTEALSKLADEVRANTAADIAARGASGSKR